MTRERMPTREEVFQWLRDGKQRVIGQLRAIGDDPERRAEIGDLHDQLGQLIHALRYMERETKKPKEEPMKLHYLTDILTATEEAVLRADIVRYRKHIIENPEDAEAYGRMLSVAEEVIAEHEWLTDAQIAGTDPVSAQVNRLLTEAAP